MTQKIVGTLDDTISLTLVDYEDCEKVQSRYDLTFRPPVVKASCNEIESFGEQAARARLGNEEVIVYKNDEQTPEEASYFFLDHINHSLMWRPIGDREWTVSKYGRHDILRELDIPFE